MKKEIAVSAESILILRVMLSGIFIVAGISHIINPSSAGLRLENSAYVSYVEMLASVDQLIALSGYALLLGGVNLLLGIYTRWSALLLLALIIPITITIQISSGILFGPLWKNIGLAGALLFFIINNPSSYGLYPKNLNNK